MFKRASKSVRSLHELLNGGSKHMAGKVLSENSSVAFSPAVRDVRLSLSSRNLKIFRSLETGRQDKPVEPVETLAALDEFFFNEIVRPNNFEVRLDRYAQKHYPVNSMHRNEHRSP